MHTMRPILWSLHHIHGLNLHRLRQPNQHILLQALKRCTRLHPSYLFATIVIIMPTKLMNATFFTRISFVIIVRKKNIRKFFVLPSSQNISNSDYHDKIYQHHLLRLNQNPRHLTHPLKLSPLRVILVRMLKRRSIMSTRGRCFKPIPLKFKLYKMNLNH